MSTLFDRAAAIDTSNGVYGDEQDLPYSLSLDLVIQDREMIRSLLDYSEGESRNQFALEALKIGMIALRHVGGQVSADLIQRESARLVKDMQQTLDQHKQLVQTQIEERLKDYFDPKSGRFSERVERLVAHDGELSTLIRNLIDGENSLISRTLLGHIGPQSPLMKQLDPGQSEGLLAMLRRMVDEQLLSQRDQILQQFSLDNKSGALARLVAELTDKHGNFSKDMQAKIDAVAKDLSLNDENSSLSRLVRNVDVAQRTITQEFSLDSEKSCLSRLKRELTELLAVSERKNQLFQEEVKVSLAKIITVREEAERSTRHGIAFEDAVCEFLACETHLAGDMAIPMCNTVGNIRNCRVGDCVIELGPESPAPGAKIVVEAKEVSGYTLAQARAEIETARKNRGADWGIFVFSKKTAPSTLQPFHPFGNDIFVIWDNEDPTGDVFLKAALVTARALSLRAATQSAAQQVDFEIIDKAILEIEKRAANLDDVRKCAETIKSSSDKILDRVRIDREGLERQVGILRERVTDLKQLVATGE